MDVQEMISLIKAVSDYGMTEFKLDNGTVKLSLKKECIRSGAVTAVQTPAAVMAEASAAGSQVPEGPGEPFTVLRRLKRKASSRWGTG